MFQAHSPGHFADAHRGLEMKVSARGWFPAAGAAGGEIEKPAVAESSNTIFDKGLLYVSPAIGLLLTLSVFPLLYDIYLSFTNADLSGGAVVGVLSANYTRVFSEGRFGEAITTTAQFVVLAVALELVLGFLLALALHGKVFGKSVVMTLLLIPMMLCPVVLSLFWKLILNGNYGVFNQLLAAFGLPTPQWLTDNDLKFLSVLLIDVWMWTPFMMLISLAALGAIPKSIYEAAEVDRAGTLTVFRRITLPMVAPMLGLAVLLRATDAIKQFDLVMAITGPNDGTTQTVSALLYQVVFRDYKVGLGASYGVVVLVAVIAVATLSVRYIQHIQGGEGST